MKKIAIVIDSSSGLTEKEVQQKGWFFLPLLVFIDDKKFQDGVDLDAQNLFDHFTINSDSAKTSATPIGIVEEKFKSLSKEYDDVIVFPISMELSSQFSILKTVAEKYPNIHIVKSIYIAALIPLKVIECLEYIENGLTVEQAIKKVEEWSEDWKITLMPKYNDYLVKGGRLHPAAATIAKLLKIVPMISFYKGQLLKESKGRVFQKTVLNSIDEKFKGERNLSKFDCILLHSNNPEIDFFADYIKEKYKINPIIKNIPNVVSIHTGPEAVVVIKVPKLSQKQRELF
ncbi:DegV family protein [Mycoplasmopsis glycophila]|uniref:Fatty acid-binding protein DegV-like protein n=1 Tax=Mycoplasmopsis glycophila TaxID=171285 RepID=A0A449AU84_9BACT|nr:DegV family protein [Mycoplasmopsis glycophila]VEU70084.1 Fatty acid-binding protein DegV-like protein [Mycoplasmopsis glycophila]